jgi:hypothetical protein
MHSSSKHGFDPKIERLEYQPRPAAEVLFDPPKFPEPPREDGEEDDARHSRLRR